MSQKHNVTIRSIESSIRNELKSSRSKLPKLRFSKLCPSDEARCYQCLKIIGNVEDWIQPESCIGKAWLSTCPECGQLIELKLRHEGWSIGPA